MLCPLENGQFVFFEAGGGFVYVVVEIRSKGAERELYRFTLVGDVEGEVGRHFFVEVGIADFKSLRREVGAVGVEFFSHGRAAGYVGLGADAPVATQRLNQTQRRGAEIEAAGNAFGRLVVDILVAQARFQSQIAKLPLAHIKEAERSRIHRLHEGFFAQR